MQNNILTLEDIENRDFWENLCQDASISDKPFNNSAKYELDDQAKEVMRAQMIEDGYFKTPVFMDSNEIAFLRNIVLNLQNNNIMPVFASVYDEFWSLLYKLRETFTPILNANYRLVPDYWIWHVAADDAATGWKPHRDGNLGSTSIRDDGTPTICTAWIPLTNVDTDNSCMSVLPRKYDAVFQDFVRKRFGQPGIENALEIPLPLNRIRALPAKAGSILGWDTNILHWGSGSSKWASGPRISIGVYYEAEEAEALGTIYDSSGRNYINYSDPACRLTFENRLTIIANIITTYLAKFDLQNEKEEHFSDIVRKFHENWRWVK